MSFKEDEAPHDGSLKEDDVKSVVSHAKDHAKSGLTLAHDGTQSVISLKDDGANSPASPDPEDDWDKWSFGAASWLSPVLHTWTCTMIDLVARTTFQGGQASERLVAVESSWTVSVNGSPQGSRR